MNKLPAITIITCTTDRELCFERCEFYGRRCLEQFDGEAQWLVCDGGKRPVNTTQGQEHVYNGYTADPLTNFHINLWSGVVRARHDILVFFEDDDYYAPDYLREIVSAIELAEVVGHGNAKYWHVPTNCWHEFTNNTHASLATTVIRGRAVQVLREVINEFKDPYIDLRLWRTLGLSKKMFLPTDPLCVGIKGMPGAAGFVPGHKKDFYAHQDEGGDLLRSWIGADAEFYLDLKKQFDEVAT